MQYMLHDSTHILHHLATRAKAKVVSQKSKNLSPYPRAFSPLYFLFPFSFFLFPCPLSLFPCPLYSCNFHSKLCNVLIAGNGELYILAAMAINASCQQT